MDNREREREGNLYPVFLLFFIECANSERENWFKVE